MPQGLRRYHQSGHSHFVTFSCYRRQPNFSSEEIYDLFPECLERMRRRFDMCIYGYVVMPEHVHLLPSEPERGTLADAIHYLKLSFSKRVKSASQLSVQPKDAKLGHPGKLNRDEAGCTVAPPAGCFPGPSAVGATQLSPVWSAAEHWVEGKEVSRSPGWGS